MTSSTLTTSLDQSSTSLNVWSIQRESTRPSHRLQPLDDSAAPNELIDTDEGQNEPVSDAKELSEKPPGAPFPAKLIVAHRWDIGQKYYECIKYLIDWINAKLADPKSLGESFMEEGGSTKKFIDIWPAFFQKMVKEETMGLVERLQTGLKVPKSASRIKGCLHFEYGVVSATIELVPTESIYQADSDSSIDRALLVSSLLLSL
ncbi:hypothetical protein DL93DRAFT_1693539 [Clavulina sp. PMI_390]|nr:hypothetical protein DL93DRAFT_1693539 [Clavulina sp. PMI_390]